MAAKRLRMLANLVLALLVLFAVGCVQRTITITSEPEGALVQLNDEEIGRTPLTVPFTFYGVYDVRLEREGYKTLWTTAKAKGPWWEAPGPDLIAEAIPNGKSAIFWHFTLEKALEDNADLLIDHAQQMRGLLQEKPAAPAPSPAQ